MTRASGWLVVLSLITPAAWAAAPPSASLAKFGDTYRGYVRSLPPHFQTEAALAGLRTHLFSLPSASESASQQALLQQGLDGLATFARMQGFGPDQIRAALERVIDGMRVDQARQQAEQAAEKSRSRRASELHPAITLAPVYEHSHSASPRGEAHLFAGGGAQILEVADASHPNQLTFQRLDPKSGAALEPAISLPAQIGDLLRLGVVPDHVISIDRKNQQVVALDLRDRTATPVMPWVPGKAHHHIAMTADARWILQFALMTTEENSLVTVVNREDPAKTRVFREPGLEDSRLSQDGSEVALWTGDAVIKIHDLEDPQKPAEEYVLEGDLHLATPMWGTFAITRDLITFVIPWPRGSKVIHLDRRTKAVTPGFAIRTVTAQTRLTPDGRYAIFVSPESGALRIYDLQNRYAGKFSVGQLPDSCDPKHTIADLSPDGRYLTLLSRDPQGATRTFAYRMADIVAQLPENQGGGP
jgi:hypothetical protein